jgi:hypothetical protein
MSFTRVTGEVSSSSHSQDTMLVRCVAEELGPVAILPDPCVGKLT